MFLFTRMKRSHEPGVTESCLPWVTICVGALLVAAMAAAVSVCAQPALQNAILNDQGIAARQQERADSFQDVEGVEAGPVQFSLSASYSLEFNDNVNYSENDPEGDFIQTPTVSLGIAVPFSERSELSFRIGVGYQIYWHNEDLSRWWLAPGSVLAYDLQVKDLYITLFDRFSYTDNVYTNPDLANQAQAPIFDNTIGTQVSWVPNHFLVTAGYSYEISFSPNEDYDYLNRRTHLPFVRGGYIFADGAANSGLEFSSTFTDYESALTQDSTIVSFGPYLDWEISDAIDTALRGGFVYTVNSLSLLPQDSFDASSFYLGLDVGHQLTDFISHGLNITHGVRPSYQQGATFTEETVVGYFLTWAFIDPASIGFNLNYTHGEQTIAAGVAPSEIYDQWRIGVGLSYAFTERWSSRLGYDYVLRDSDLPNRSYTQNRVTLGLSYRFL